jgi:hypothetical protein
VVWMVATNLHRVTWSRSSYHLLVGLAAEFWKDVCPSETGDVYDEHDRATGSTSCEWVMEGPSRRLSPRPR